MRILCLFLVFFSVGCSHFQTKPLREFCKKEGHGDFKSGSSNLFECTDGSIWIDCGPDGIVCRVTDGK